MASTDIRQFLWYFKYLVSPTDMTNLQDWVEKEFRGIAEGAFGGAILQGLVCTPGGGMVVTVPSGIAVSPSGRLVVVSGGSATLATPVGNPAKSLVVLRPKLTSMTSIPDPANPSSSVYLHQKLDYDIVAINGTPAATPVYPSTQADDIVVMGVSLAAAQSSIAVTDFERSPISLTRKGTKAYRSISANYTVVSTDEHVDVDATSTAPTVVLPSAQTVPGQQFRFVKTDSSANVVSVSGQGSDLIDGQTFQELGDQWSVLNLFSTGTAWRVV